FWSRIERRLQDLAGELLPDDFKNSLDQARDALEAGRAAEAAELLADLSVARPEHAGAHYLHGAALLDLGRVDEASAAFDRAIERAGDLPEAYLGRGETRLRHNQPTEAIADFRRAQARAGGERSILAAAYRGAGMAHRLAGDVDKAIRELRKSVAESPSDPAALAALGDALCADPDGSRAEARRHLRRAADAADAPVLTWLALGWLDLAEGDATAARAWYERAASAARARPEKPVPPDSDSSLADALAGLGDAELALGDPPAAAAHYREALAVAGGVRADLHARLGDALSAAGDHAAALASYRAGLENGGGRDVERRALDAALAADDLVAAVPLASRILADDPSDARALIAQGRSLLRAGEREGAQSRFLAALERDRGPESRLALAELALAGDPSAETAARAAEWALGGLRAAPRDARARSVLADARGRELEVRDASAVDPTDPGALYELASELDRLCQRRPELAHLSGEAARTATDFDQPLLVTVMGEFSSGKSTFINAFIGEDVAPTGITPTTATINVVKYGRERGGRILYRDGRTESLAWSALFDRMRALGPEQVRQVSLVEILLPLDSLQRVNLIDTPGLNSILPEHEEVARGFIARADAVVWLFAAQQAGKATERAALAAVAGEGVRLLGVLNKVDQIDEGEQRAVVRYVERQLGELVEAVVPLSARRALESRGADPAWQVLLAALEERFFTRAREIKRQMLGRRLRGLLARAGERVTGERSAAAETGSRRRAAAEAARSARAQFFDQAVARERRRLSEGAALLYRSAAREVLELVVPRRLPFGSHRASRADRDYLVSLLDGGFAALLEQSRRRVDGELREGGAGAVALAQPAPELGASDPATAEVLRALSDSIEILDAQVYARTLAYLRGYLEGGYVDAFFRCDLPKLNLDEDAVYHALYRDSPDLDATVAVPLAESGCAALERVAERLGHLADLAELGAYDLEVGPARALDGLSRRLEGL
ncbi:MAG TPA: dynamin family protein, partial [Kofleriaceae bacterium]|nr:dynamin family protein [Kofleriaceae bacterium]